MEDKNKKIIFSIILMASLFVLAILSGYWLATKESKSSRLNEKFRLDKDEIYQLIEEKNNYPEAINKINFLLQENQFTNLGQKANLKITLAEVYIYDFLEIDFKKGIDVLKEVASSNNYPRRWRAMALERLAFFAGVRDESFAKENIFNDVYFSAMMKENDLSLAQKRLYEKSQTLYKTVMPYYRIANWYALQLLNDNKLSAENKIEYLQAAKENLKLGEDYFNESYPRTVWDADRLVMAYQTYAEVATKLYVLKEFDDSQKIIDAYGKAIAVYEEKYAIQQWPVAKSEIKAPILRAQLPPLVFAYASSLAMMQKPLEQKKIQALLEILYDKNWDEKSIFDIFAFLNNNKKGTYKNKYSRFKIMSLAKADSRFAELLAGMGWTIPKAVDNLGKSPITQSASKK